jgi:hypothetical protein
MASNKQENGFEFGDRRWQCSVVPEAVVYTNSIHQVQPPSNVCDEPTLNNLFSANSDVYLGYIGWSAGSFDSTYGQHFLKALLARL